MGADWVPSVVMTNPFGQDPTEMLFVQRDHEIRTLASYAPYQSFTKCIPVVAENQICLRLLGLPLAPSGA